MNTKKIITTWVVLTVIAMVMIFAPFFNFYGLKEKNYIDTLQGFFLVYGLYTIYFINEVDPKKI